MSKLDCSQWLAKEFWQKAEAEDVKRCLSEGADINARAGNGGTPLHWAAVFSPVHGEIFLLLVVHMAAWHERFSFWKTA